LRVVWLVGRDNLPVWESGSGMERSEMNAAIEGDGEEVVDESYKALET
jgi:hypothetical protein